MITREQLCNNYNQLTALERFVVQLVSVVYEPTSRTTIVRCLQECQQALPTNNLSISASIGVILAKCQKFKLLNERIQCHPQLVEVITRQAVAEHQFKVMARAVQTVLPLEATPNHFYSHLRCLRDIRIALYGADILSLNRCIERGASQFPNLFTKSNPLITICNNPFDINWFKALPMRLQTTALNHIVEHAIVALEESPESLSLLNTYQDNEPEEQGVELRDTLLTKLLFNTEVEPTKELLKKNQGTAQGFAKQAWLSFLHGDYQAAIGDFEIALKILKKVQKKKKVTLDHFSSIFYILSVVKAGNDEQLAQISDYLDLIEKQNTFLLQPTFSCLKAAVLIQQNKVNEATELLEHLETQANDNLSQFFLSLVSFWLEPESAKQKSAKLETIYSSAHKNGYDWLAFECAELLDRLGTEDQDLKQFATSLKSKSNLQSITALIDHEPPWQRSLNALQELCDNPPTAKTRNRMIWLLDPESKEITPVEQKFSNRGEWSRGRTIALCRLYEQDRSLDFLTEQDKAIATAIKKHTDSSSNVSYYFETNRALRKMVNHPLLFLAGDEEKYIPIDLMAANPELVVEQEDQELLIRLSTRIGKDQVQLVRETPTRFCVLTINKFHQMLDKMLGEEGLRIPLAAKEQVTQLIVKISSLITVQSDIGGMGKEIPRVAADPSPRIHLLPCGDGLRLEFFVKPFCDAGPYFKPANGGKTLIAKINGERVQTRRNFGQERQQAQHAIDECPSLINLEDIDKELILDHPEDCLNALYDLQALEDNVVLEWPEGQKFKIRNKVSANNLSLNISKQEKSDWFDVNGEIELDENHKVTLAELMKMMDKSVGRFVPLDDGQFIALTKELHRRLEELRRFADVDEKDNIQIHQLSAHTVEGLATNAAELKVDKHWRDLVKHLHNRPEASKVPSTLMADLRSYQQEGYEWLMRLADWGVGACLADDMGLGKTLQGLTTILARASKGPSLVVAPTSVCFNWIDEAKRFAPSLNPVSFGQQDRQKTAESLKAFDVLVCSYGLLQQEIERLENIPWQTIVLDEAQAIKNVATKRSQAAMALNGNFKVITTGTPIENNLSELWNLFRFINPGLLGSFDKFNQSFINPIEKNQCKDASQHLRKLIQPFILRRMKTQVLEELPPRTEIVLHVEMSEEETAFYESLRSQALEKLNADDRPAEQKHMQILAEITKLRRACCNPALIDPKIGIKSSKLSLFAETLEELVSNNHKALVFSQFVGHLELIKGHVEAEHLAYQYLDGSTPMGERKKRIDKFQGGEGDLFLISLKAGGTGLNLTAADYVLHMDPWWNPAVEDQASDRAYRIGQQRPVTIYRLIVKNTIEEKIMALHQKKRDLADSLLEGTEMSAKLSSEELLNLIRAE